MNADPPLVAPVTFASRGCHRLTHGARIDQHVPRSATPYARQMLRDRSTLTVGVLSALLVVVAVAMIALGLPEQTLLQRRLLQLYSVPLSGALALGMVHLLGKLPSVNAATRTVLVIAAVASAVGVALMAVGLLLGLDALLPLGQALTWLTLGFALLWVVAQLPRRSSERTFGLRPVDDETVDD